MYVVVCIVLYDVICYVYVLNDWSKLAVIQIEYSEYMHMEYMYMVYHAWFIVIN